MTDKPSAWPTQLGSSAVVIVEMDGGMVPIVAETSGQQAWMDEQKTRLKTQRADELLQTLYQHLEGAGVNDSDAPVRQCRRYLNHRREQLNYQSALVHDLPIGSGEIESAHRYIVQQRLKRPGAWWCAANADHTGLAAQSREPAVGCVLGSKQHDQHFTSV